MEKEKNLTQPEEKKSLFFKFIHGIEVVGNKLPQPFYLFSILIVVAIILSVIFSGATTTYEKASSAGGVLECGVTYTQAGDAPDIQTAFGFRTANLLMDGVARVRP